MGQVQQRAGGGKVTVEGLTSEVLLTGNTVTIRQGSKAVQNVVGKFIPIHCVIMFGASMGCIYANDGKGPAFYGWAANNSFVYMYHQAPISYGNFKRDCIIEEISIGHQDCKFGGETVTNAWKGRKIAAGTTISWRISGTDAMFLRAL